MTHLTLEEQIKAYKALSDQIAELEKQKKALSSQILEQMTRKSMQFDGYKVTRYDRLSIKLSLEEARKWSATKTQEVLDRSKIKELYLAGHPIPDVVSLPGLMLFSRKPSKDAAAKELD